jgi:hypothetical protein
MKMFFFIWSRRLMRLLRCNSRFKEKVSDADIRFTMDWDVERAADLFGVHVNTIKRRRTDLETSQ